MTNEPIPNPSMEDLGLEPGNKDDEWLYPRLLHTYRSYTPAERRAHDWIIEQEKCGKTLTLAEKRTRFWYEKEKEKREILPEEYLARINNEERKIKEEEERERASFMKEAREIGSTYRESPDWDSDY